MDREWRRRRIRIDLTGAVSMLPLIGVSIDDAMQVAANSLAFSTQFDR